MIYEFLFGSVMTILGISVAVPSTGIPFRWIRGAFNALASSASKRMKDTLQMAFGWGAMLLGIYVAFPVPHRYDPAVALLLAISVVYYWWRGRHTGSEVEDRSSMIDVTPTTSVSVEPVGDRKRVS